MSANLDVLIEYLDGDQNEYGLDFAGTHGFLVASVVGPQLNNWLDHLFDGQLANVPSTIVAHIKQWQQDIQQQLNNEEDIEFPVEIEEASVDSSLGDWCIGFVDAMFLNEEFDWFDKDEEAVGMLTMPMMVFSGIEESDPDLIAMRNNVDLLEEMAEEIPDNITKLYLLFHSPES